MTGIEKVKSKVALLGAKIVQENDFGLYTEDADKQCTVYRLLPDGQLDTQLLTEKFEECEAKKHFILASNIEGVYKQRLYVKYKADDLLKDCGVSKIPYDEGADLPLIWVMLDPGLLVINKYGDRIYLPFQVDTTYNKVSLGFGTTDDGGYVLVLSEQTIFGSIKQSVLASITPDLKELKISNTRYFRKESVKFKQVYRIE